MKKKLLTILTVVLVMVCLLTVNVSAADKSGTCGDNATWSFDEATGTLTVSGEGAMKYNRFFDWSDPYMPWRDWKTDIKSVVIEDGITSLCYQAFAGCTELTEVSMGEGVQTIGQEAFDGCENLRSVDLCEGLTEIKGNAFAGCTALKEVILPNTVVKVGVRAFYGCSSLQRAVLSAGLAELPMHLFRDCTSLTEVEIPDGVKSFDNAPFVYCTSLQSIRIPDSVTSIGGGAFTGCSSLSEVILPKGLTCVEAELFYECTSLREVHIPEGVTSIEESAFYGCTSLEEVHIPEGVTSIGGCAFYECAVLKEIHIPDSVTSIGDGAFHECVVLKEIHIPDSVTSIGDGAFYGTGLTEAVVPDETKVEYGTELFAECVHLKSVVFPESITTIEYCMFRGCTSLTELTIPDTVTHISSWAFNGCTGLRNIVLPAGVEAISNNAFEGCTGLQSVQVPLFCIVGPEAFLDCTALKTVYYPGDEDGWEYLRERSLQRFSTSEEKYMEGNAYFYGAEVVFGWGCTHEETYFDGDTEPTCTENGSTGDEKCGQCKALLKESEVIPALKHDEEILPGTPATCEEAGITEGTKCKRCGAVTKEQTEVPALGHDYAENILNKPTCGEYGLAKYICKNDESHFYVDAVDPTGDHDYDIATGICKVCEAENPDFVANPFTDVAETDWFYNPVLWAFKSGVTGGKTADTFAPNEGCTRAQVVTFLWAANGKPEPKSMVNIFADVSEDAWYLKPVLWAVENGITGGIADGKFGPDQTCTRAQIVTFLYAAMKKPAVDGVSSFSDVADTDWFAKPVIWAAENEVTGGIGDGKFGPNNTCTRAQVVTFLYKVYG